MRQPLAKRKARGVPYKTLVQSTNTTGYYMRGIGLDHVYEALDAAIRETRQQKQAETVKTLTDNIQEQDNSDLHIIELPEPEAVPQQQEQPTGLSSDPLADMIQVIEEAIRDGRLEDLQIRINEDEDE